MRTNETLKRELRSVLREVLDREQGPDPVWPDSPAARRVVKLDRREHRRRWPLRVLAVAALVGAGSGAALLAGRPAPPPDMTREAANGWIAFTVAERDSAGGDEDLDIWLVALDRDARRVIGTDTDRIDQVCPAFAPDGRSLAYGRSEGRSAALVVADVSDDGRVSDRLTIDVGDDLSPPCAVWSPAGDRLAFGVPRTSPINPDRSGEGSEVWVVRLSDRNVTVLPDLLATDLEWSPDGSLLAIAGGVEVVVGEGVRDGLQDARIHLYTPSSGTMRSLDDTLGVSSLTWSPQGGRIAYEGGRLEVEGDWTRKSLRVIDVETGRQEVLADTYVAFHGIGPVWSPDGATIAYQRRPGPGGEGHAVVLLTPEDRSAQTVLAGKIQMPIERATAGGSSVELFPWSVTWSPDGAYLVYVAWTYPNGCCEEGTIERTVVAAVPTDQDAPAVLLADMDGISAGAEPRVPIQMWGRR